jgi:hypothetical protein
MFFTMPIAADRGANAEPAEASTAAKEILGVRAIVISHHLPQLGLFQSRRREIGRMIRKKSNYSPLCGSMTRV